MISFRINIARCVIEVNACFPSTRAYCAEYLDDGIFDFSIILRQEDIVYERQVHSQQNMMTNINTVVDSDAYLEPIALQRKIAEELFSFDTLLFHGSVVAVDDAAYLFTAKSGTGKSTHTRLWREMLGQQARMINDDKPFLRMEEKKVIACGSPWNGKHGVGSNIHVPLKAICILEQATTNSITPISPQEALPMLIQQSNRPRDTKMLVKYLDLINQLSTSVNFYRLACNMDIEAAKLSYETMVMDKWRK